MDANCSVPAVSNISRTHGELSTCFKYLKKKQTIKKKQHKNVNEKNYNQCCYFKVDLSIYLSIYSFNENSIHS